MVKQLTSGIQNQLSHGSFWPIRFPNESICLVVVHNVVSVAFLPLLDVSSSATLEHFSFTLPRFEVFFFLFPSPTLSSFKSSSSGADMSVIRGETWTHKKMLLRDETRSEHVDVTDVTICLTLTSLECLCCSLVD